MTIDIGDLVNRTRRDFLEAPDELWVSTRLTAAVADSAGTFSIDLALLGFEEQNLLAPGVLVEVGTEQCHVVDLSGSELTVRRAARGTRATAHLSGAEVLIAPPYGRTTIFDAVAESIVDLSPPLYHRDVVEREVDEDGLVELPEGTDGVLSVRLSRHWATLPFEQVGDTKLRIYGCDPGEDVTVTVRSGFTYPASEQQSLHSLGVRDEWARIVVVGAAAQLISAKPLSTSWQEFVSSQLRTEGYPVETPGRIRDSLLRYHQFLIDRAAAAQLRRHPPEQVYTT